MPNSVQTSSPDPSQKRPASSRRGMVTSGAGGSLPLPTRSASSTLHQFPCLTHSCRLASCEFLLCLPTFWSCYLDPLPPSPCPSPIRFLTDLQSLAQTSSSQGSLHVLSQVAGFLCGPLPAPLSSSQPLPVHVFLFQCSPKSVIVHWLVFLCKVKSSPVGP